MKPDETMNPPQNEPAMSYRVYARIGRRTLLVWQTDGWIEACRVARSMAGYVVGTSGTRVFSGIP